MNVAFGGEFTMGRGLPADNIAKATFWNNLSSSIESNVADYDVAYANNTTHATFTVTNEVVGTAGNGDSLSEDSTLVYGLETTTGGGVNQAGSVHGDFITIKNTGSVNIKFVATTSSVASDATNRYIQMTGSNNDFWNALSQSIKDHTEFDIINISGTVDMPTRILSLTSSIRENYSNSSIGTISGPSF